LAFRIDRSEGGSAIASLHVGAELPGDDVAAVVVEDRGEVEPAPADDLQVGEIGLPKLVPGGELIGGLYHHEGRTGDQVAP
jgi:hypothetical protein